jgi:hypothetical protein
MPGEPSWFDVSSLETIEIETATGVEHPSNIIDWNENFYLRATIQGDTSQNEWANMAGGGVQYRVRFYARSMTPGVDDVDFGFTQWTDVPNQNTIIVDSQQLTIGANGLFECGCWVEFQHANNARYYGVLGYNSCPLQIHLLEEVQ